MITVKDYDRSFKNSCPFHIIEYLPQADGKRDPSDFTPELSRRARGVNVWAALRHLGRSGVAELVERLCYNARRMAKGLAEAGFEILATRGTAAFLRENGVAAERVFKVNEGRPHCVDRLRSGDIALVINTPLGGESFYDEASIRQSATQHGVLVLTTLTAAAATVKGVQALREHVHDARLPLQRALGERRLHGHLAGRVLDAAVARGEHVERGHL